MSTANTIQLNGQDFEVLPLNWKQLKRLRPQILIVNGLNPAAGLFTEEEAEAIKEIVTAALQRKRSDLTSEFVEEHLDFGNVGNLLRMCFGQKPLVDGQAQAVQPGEAGAVVSKS